MKASIITQPGGPEVLVLQEREKPSIKATEVLVKVIAAGVNRPDVAQRAGRYPAPPGAPADIPGLELAGIIVETGAEVTTLKIGDEVCALVAGGAYAEFCTVPAELCLPVPKGLTMVEAASLPETFLRFGAMCLTGVPLNRKNLYCFMVAVVELEQQQFKWLKL